MKKLFKRTLAIMLTVVMLFGVVLLGGFNLSTKANAMDLSSYSVGDTITFGSYPQSKVTDSATISALDAMSKSWISYGYYSGTGDRYHNMLDGQMKPSNYMKYADISYCGNKYRAVTFSSYRPIYTQFTFSISDTSQYQNGYYTGNVYYFKYEPLTWRVLDPSNGFVMCEKAIDSQAYNNYILYYDNGNNTSDDDYYGNSAKTYYASDWANSSLRAWLNDDFYNTAFTSSEKLQIGTTYNENKSTSSSQYDSANTYDKIFLLSVNEVLNSRYGFNSSYSTYDTARQIKSTDYAQCQGCYTSTDTSYLGNSSISLRSPCKSDAARHVSYNSLVNISAPVSSTNLGIVPVFKFNLTQNDTTKPTGSISSKNNVAASQTVTLSLSDNVGVAGYYWGTSSTYSSNTYTATSSSSVTKTISSAGTYYLTVKDTSGNVSSNYSITFYKTTLNANGGSVSPTSVLTKSGNSFTLPTPTKSGYTYSGWATSSTATSGVTTLKPTSNATYYAVWTYVDTTNPTGSISSTNNVAASQTVTLSLSDNVGVAGYYWGTSSTYSSNTYTATSSSSVTKTISSAGTYYLTVKDTSGNVSSNYSITFYKTTLNANGGSVSPTSVLTKSGNSFTFPTPTKSGYTYSGWATSSTATSGVKSLTPNSNSTYYAVWKSVSQRFNQSNRYSFKNSHSCFFGHDKVDGNKDGWCDLCHGSYYLNESDYNKLISYIKKYDSSSSSTISNVQNLMYSSWGGSCYGMAATAVLDYQNKIGFNENFGNGAKTLWDVKSPSTDKNVMSAINYYMVSQKIGFVRNSSSYYDKDYYPSSWTPGLKKLVSTAQKGEPFLFCYYWTSGYNSYGHAIVAYDCTTNSDGSFSVIAYDNRYPNKDVIIKVNSNYTSCVVNGNENAEAFEIYNDMSAFDKIDIDGPKNDMKISYDSYTYSGASDEISIVADGDVTVTNALGETISIVNGDISSTMDILSVHMVVRSTEDGEPAPAEFVFEVGHSQSYYFESDNDNMDVSVKTNNIFGSATSENADYIAIGDDGVYVIGNNMNYSAALSSKDNGYDTVVLEGTAKRNVSLTYSGSNILISGVNGKDETISIFAHDAMVAEDYEIKEGYSELKVVTENNDIDIKGSSNSDGRFDISVLKKGKVNSVSINNIEMNYKSSAKINPVISADSGVDYKVEYKSSNASVATVDQNGNVYGAKKWTKGTTTITCTVTDDYGNVVTDTCTVTCGFTWWQWIIGIVLFGWIWY